MLTRRLIEKDPVDGLLIFLNSFDFPEIEALLKKIETDTLFFDVVTAKRESLLSTKRAWQIVEQDVAHLMGFICLKCGLITTLNCSEKKCICGGKRKLLYLTTYRNLKKKGIFADPMQVLEYYANSRLYEAYIAMLEALYIVSKKTNYDWTLIDKNQLSLCSNDVIQFIILTVIEKRDIKQAKKLIRKAFSKRFS